MGTAEPYIGLGIALAIGMLVGVERGWSARGEPAGGRVAGFRTFGLLGLLGGLAGIQLNGGYSLVAAALIASAGGALVVGYIHDMRRNDNVSATTTVAGILTMALGTLAVTGQPVAASASAAAMLILLAMREELHAFVGALSAIEVKAVARFALITAVVWPLLPDASYGPYDAWNPRDLWMVVVLISGVSFAGYALNRWLGDVRGTLATAAAGALVSSTVVTAALAQRLKDEDMPAPIIAGIAAAGAVMTARVLVLAAVLAPIAAPTLAVVVIPAGLAAGGVTLWYLRTGKADGRTTDRLDSRNPFDLLPALGFGMLLAAAALFARWASDVYGNHGTAVVVAITGAFDVDAATVTVGGLPPGILSPRTAGLVLAVPVLLNTAFKAAVCIGIAGWRRGRAAAGALALSLAAGVAAVSVMLF